MNPINHTSTAPVLAVSQDAAEKVKALINEEGNPSLCLRVLVTPGGCKGLEYGFAFDERSGIDKDADTVFETQGITLVVDDYVLKHYLNRATIRYEKGVGGERFIVDNPNAAASCGCGTSFCDKQDNAPCEEDSH